MRSFSSWNHQPLSKTCGTCNCKVWLFCGNFQQIPWIYHQISVRLKWESQLCCLRKKLRMLLSCYYKISDLNLFGLTFFRFKVLRELFPASCAYDLRFPIETVQHWDSFGRVWGGRKSKFRIFFVVFWWIWRWNQVRGGGGSYPNIWTSWWEYRRRRGCDVRLIGGCIRSIKGLVLCYVEEF
jgi:hypothetical protein